MLVDIIYRHSPFIYLAKEDRYRVYKSLSSLSGTYKDNHEAKFTTRRYMGNSGEFIIRTKSDLVKDLLSDLNGKSITIGKHTITFENHHIAPLDYSENLRSHYVIFIHSKLARYGVREQQFNLSLSNRLAELGIKQPPMIKQEKLIIMNGYTYHGYPIEFKNLSEKESLNLQTHGIGGKQKMGCGIFTQFTQRY